MADTKISALPVVTSLAASDVLVVDAAGTTSQIALSNFNKLPGGVDISGLSGTPSSGHLRLGISGTNVVLGVGDNTASINLTNNNGGTAWLSVAASGTTVPIGNLQVSAGYGKFISSASGGICCTLTDNINATANVDFPATSTIRWGVGAAETTIFASGGTAILTVGNINGGGVVTAHAGVTGGVYTLASGTQETGECGAQQVAATGSQDLQSAVNFKTKMTNAPSSITFSAATSFNNGGASAALIGNYGFRFQITSTGSGNTYYIGTYTTVGN